LMVIQVLSNPNTLSDMSKNLQMEKMDMYNTTSIYLILQTNPDIHQLPSKTQIAFDLKPKGTKQKRKILYARMGRCPQSAPLDPVSVLCVSTVSVFCCSIHSSPYTHAVLLSCWSLLSSFSAILRAGHFCLLMLFHDLSTLQVVVFILIYIENSLCPNFIVKEILFSK